MTYTEVQEAVQALVEFSPQGEVKPLAFIWSGRRHRIKRTTYRWRTGRGRETCRHFAVITESDDSLQLTYREESATWWIEQVWNQG